MSAQQTALIVDDEADVLDLVRLAFRRQGLGVLVAQTGAEALAIARDRRPDVVILDLMLPEMSGTEVCRELKRDPDTADIPIIMLTAKRETPDRIAGLELGAEDYVTKPFSPKELVLRTMAVLRRSQMAEAASTTQTVDGITLNLVTLEVFVDNRKLDLTATEFKLLHLLIERRGKVQSRDTLLREVWGYQNSITTRTVDTHMRRLREKLGIHAARLETLRGEGYRYRPRQAPAEPDAALA